VIAKEQVPTAMNQHATTQESLGAVYSVFLTAAVAMQWHSTHISAAMNQHSTIEELLATVFSAWSMPSGYQWDKFRAYFSNS
jgi:hypothetical protein